MSRRISNPPQADRRKERLSVFKEKAGFVTNTGRAKTEWHIDPHDWIPQLNWWFGCFL
jgi:hypothetical protein